VPVHSRSRPHLRVNGLRLTDFREKGAALYMVARSRHLPNHILAATLRGWRLRRIAQDIDKLPDLVALPLPFLR
jgi:hypothetical protein